MQKPIVHNIEHFDKEKTLTSTGWALYIFIPKMGWHFSISTPTTLEKLYNKNAIKK